MEMTIFLFSRKQLQRCLGNACERWDMNELYISVLYHSSWEVYLPLDFVNYLITQPIWIGVSWAQYEKFPHKFSIEGIYDGMDTDHDCSYKRVRNWKHQNPNSTKPRSTKMVYVITGSQIAMTTADINSSAQQMWSTWCARRHSYKCGPRGAHVDTPTNVFHVVRT